MSSKADGTHPDIPEKSWTNPFSPGTWLHDHFEEIVREKRDIIILIDDSDANRGTGKTIASLQLANAMNQHGHITHDHATLQPEEIIEAYTSLPKRSGLVLDEAQVEASNRSAMTNINKALRKIMSMGRVEEKYVVVNTPAREFIDGDIQKLSDVWISMERKGLGLVHKFEREQYTGKLLTPKKQRIEFKDIPKSHPVRDVYNSLTREKRAKMRGQDGTGYIERSKHTEIVQRKTEKARKETRDDIIYNIYTHPKIDVSQSDLGEAVGVSQKTVSNIKQRREGEK